MSKTYVLLVVECTPHLNWYETFSGVSLSDGSTIQVEQAGWEEISLTSYHDAGVVLSINKAKNPLPGTSQERHRTVKVDFVLLRSVSRGVHLQDSRNLLFGLIHANIPSVNSLNSAYMCLDRAIVFGALKDIQSKLGRENFPLIAQTFYPHHREMLITPEFPIVAKVGHAHSGFGKIKIKSSEEFQDFKSLCALHGDYVTVEPFIPWDFDMRIQKIGPYYRGFQRISSNWKGNTGNSSVIEDLEVTPQYKLWVDECSKLFGGLDILGLDLLHSKEDGKVYILELNDTAIGLVHKYELEDMKNMRDIVITKMEKLFVKKDEAGPSSRTPESQLETVELLTSQIEVLKTSVSEKDRKIAGLEQQINNLNSEKGKKKSLFGF
eukprot:TRINITY_DN260_c0_g1_i3.p1 TRINITY_DN260_c0_g1~~TRINITY_DN260_c0_g1_i3.p1  ORF type:complete len:379 (-),score=87.44 TRINITY_DN260_c0_g1_i3:91-1227(-)